MSDNSLFNHISLVLHQPRFAENIGASARAAWNMGLSHIIVVNPEDTDWERMTKLSTHMARGLLEKMKTYSSLAEALAPFQYIVGTTARLGGQRKEIIGPSQAARKIQSLGPQNRIAVLFGPENRGLSNEELRFCHCIVHIPTVSASSLNLGQAVLILCYEILMAYQADEFRICSWRSLPSRFHRDGFPVSDCGLRIDPNSDSEPPSPVLSLKTIEPKSPDSQNSAIPCRLQDPQSAIQLASSFELEGMYQHLSEALQMMDFLDKQNPELWMMSLRRYFSRTGLQSNEVRMIRGVCRQLKWFITRYRPEPDQLRTPNSEP